MTEAARVVVVTGEGAAFLQEVRVGPHALRADEPIEAGGAGAGPTPYDLLGAALGTCTSMTLGYYARAHRYPLETVTVQVRHSRAHAADCASCESKEGRIDRFDRDIQVTGPLSEDQRRELLRIADRCPVHRTLMSEIEIRTRLV